MTKLPLPRILERALDGVSVAPAGRRLGVLLLGLLLACAPAREERVEEIRALHVEGRFAETLEPLSVLLDRFPDDPELNHLYGVTLLATENASLAVWPLRKVAEHPDAGVEDHLLLARALRLGGAPREASGALELVLAVEPDQVEALVLQAGIALESKRFTDVLQSAERVVALEPRRWPMAHVWRAKALAELDRFDEAFEALESGIATLGRRPDIDTLRPMFCKVGVEIAEGEGDEGKVEERWESCLREFPTESELVEGAVAFFDERKQRGRATAVLEKAVETAPRRVEYRARLARRLAAERRSEEAEEILLEATKLDGLGGEAWLAVADYFREREDYAAAVRAAERAFQEFETIPVLAFAQYADDLVQAREFEKAEKVIAEIDRPEYAALLRGRISLLQGEPEKALEKLREGLRLFQGNPTARSLAGQAAEQLGDFDLAVSEYRDSVRSDPAGSDAVFALARLYEAEGKYNAVQHVLGLRILKVPDDPRANTELARIATELGRVDAAKAAIQKLADLPGQEVAAAVAAARLESQLSGPAAAVTAIESEGLDLTRPEHVDALRAVVGHLAEAGRSPEGLRAARAAVGAHPEFAPFHEVHASALRAAGQRGEEVEEALEHALERDPESAVALSGLAELAAESGRIDAALDLYDRAAAADPENPAPAWSAIELAFSSGRQDAEIDRRLEEVLARHPIHAGAANLQARRLLARGSDLDRAETLARRAVRFRGGAAALETQGLVALELGKTAPAVRSLRRALRMQPESPSTRYQLARALVAAGDRSAAREALQEALASEDFPEASAARAELARLDAEDGDE